MASLQYMSIMYSHWCLKVIWHQTMITRRQNMLTCFRILCTLYGQHSTGAIKYNKYIYQTATYQLVSQLQGKPHSNENKKSHSHNENISIKLTQEHKLYCQSRWSNPWHITTPQIQTDVSRAITVKKHEEVKQQVLLVVSVAVLWLCVLAPPMRQTLLGTFLPSKIIIICITTTTRIINIITSIITIIRSVNTGYARYSKDVLRKPKLHTGSVQNECSS